MPIYVPTGLEGLGETLSQLGATLGARMARDEKWQEGMSLDPAKGAEVSRKYRDLVVDLGGSIPALESLAESYGVAPETVMKVVRMYPMPFEEGVAREYAGRQPLQEQVTTEGVPAYTFSPGGRPVRQEPTIYTPTVELMRQEERTTRQELKTREKVAGFTGLEIDAARKMNIPTLRAKADATNLTLQALDAQRKTNYLKNLQSFIDTLPDEPIPELGDLTYRQVYSVSAYDPGLIQTLLQLDDLKLQRQRLWASLARPEGLDVKERVAVYLQMMERLDTLVERFKASEGREKDLVGQMIQDHMFAYAQIQGMDGAFSRLGWDIIYEHVDKNFWPDSRELIARYGASDDEKEAVNLLIDSDIWGATAAERAFTMSDNPEVTKWWGPLPEHERARVLDRIQALAIIRWGPGPRDTSTYDMLPISSRIRGSLAKDVVDDYYKRGHFSLGYK